MNKELLEMTNEERLQIKLEEEKMLHEMDAQLLIDTIECLENKLSIISNQAR